MPRQRRIHLDGKPMDLVQRGISRELCFSAEEAYQCYRPCLEQAAQDRGCAVSVCGAGQNGIELRTPNYPFRLAQQQRLSKRSTRRRDKGERLQAVGSLTQGELLTTPTLWVGYGCEAVP